MELRKWQALHFMLIAKMSGKHVTVKLLAVLTKRLQRAKALGLCRSLAYILAEGTLHCRTEDYYHRHLLPLQARHPSGTDPVLIHLSFSSHASEDSDRQTSFNEFLAVPDPEWDGPHCRFEKCLLCEEAQETPSKYQESSVFQTDAVTMDFSRKKKR